MAISKKMDEAPKKRVPHGVNDNKAHESFMQEAMASWASYQKTGLHLSAQEVRDWIDTWGTEQAVPACHTTY